MTLIFHLLPPYTHPSLPPSRPPQIEYKLKLPSPSPVRLAKLQTQLKWRLVEGGGMALYEIGLLDDGTLVGLGEDEMNESLQTLGLMLRGLGGGEIRVGRVVRLGGGAGRRREGGGDANASSGDDADPPPSPSPSPSSLFKSFVVEGEEPEAYDPGEPLPLLGTLPIAIPTSSTTSSSSASSSTNGQQKQPRPYPERTPEERAALKRSKRDARRYRDADGNDIPRPASEARPPREERVVVVPKPPKPKPPKPVKEQVGGGNGGEAMAASRKPKMAVEGEVRFVVEAVVLTKGGMRRAEEREEEREGEPEEGEEGWRYLDFDWMQDAKGFVR